MESKSKKKIEKLLSEMASINATLGTDSTRKEISSAARKIRNRELKIKEISLDFYKEICPYEE